MFEDEAKEITDRIIEALDWQGPVLSISAFNKMGTDTLCTQVMDFIETLPAVEDEVSPEDKTVEFKWDTYHQDAVSGLEDDLDDDEDWDEDDYDVEVEYRR